MDYRATPQQLGFALKRAMRAQGLSQEVLAERVGLSQSQVSRIVAGNVRRLPKALGKIVEAARLDSPVVEGFDEDEFLESVRSLLRRHPDRQVAIRRAFEAIEALV